MKRLSIGLAVATSAVWQKSAGKIQEVHEMGKMAIPVKTANVDISIGY